MSAVQGTRKGKTQPNLFSLNALLRHVLAKGPLAVQHLIKNHAKGPNIHLRGYSWRGSTGLKAFRRQIPTHQRKGISKEKKSCKRQRQRFPSPIRASALGSELHAGDIAIRAHVQYFAESEICNFNSIAFIQENVGGLQIIVNNLKGKRGGDGAKRAKAS